MAKKFLVGFVLFLFPIYSHAQAVSPVTSKRATISVGGYFSYGQTDYGQWHAYGPGIYGDFDYRIWNNFGVGIEGEARWRDWLTNSSAVPAPHGLYEQNYLGGPRITYTMGRRWLPYVKFLVGGSRFHYPNFPFPMTQTYTYTTYAIGGGIDWHLNSRWTIRPADFEYQRWDFPPTGLTPWVYSAGVSFRIF